MIRTTLSSRTSKSLAGDLLLAGGLTMLVVIARAIPHVPDFTPVVAAALFAGMMLRSRVLALAVPVVAMLASDLIIGLHDWRVMAVVYAGLLLPAVLGVWGRKHRIMTVLPPLALSSSLLFFAISNLAVWAFSGMYAHDFGGLRQCFVMALPFLRDTLAGDLLWTAGLFGSWWLAQRLTVSRGSNPRHGAPSA